MEKRIKIEIRGTVQGVGFRPFIYNLANKLELTGSVNNDSYGVEIFAQGDEKNLKIFLNDIIEKKPRVSYIHSLEYSYIDLENYSGFEIIRSSNKGELSAFILPDIAVCPECLNELFDKNNPRYKYPFINCTNCGPRFSIIKSLPYDRKSTSMSEFEMCADCKKEYNNPVDRRFHAQPIGCNKCGPKFQLKNFNNEILYEQNDAINEAISLIKSGHIIAVKGIGGYHLICDATSDEVIRRLRIRKAREEKPLALMIKNVDAIMQYCEVDENENRILNSIEAPIVLLRKKIPLINISNFVAPNNNYLGIMLPYTPLHHIMLNKLEFPIIATSANISDEPIIYKDEIALYRLKNIADYILTNNREIIRHSDDSIVRIVNDKEFVIRRSRGYAPFPVKVNFSSSEKIIALGGQLKNTIAFNNTNNIFISQHIGDLETNESFNLFSEIIADYQKIFAIKNPMIITDKHPEYLSTKYGKEKFFETFEVQHHIAHIAACRAENQVIGNALGVTWDGTGYGEDGTIWGGEFFYSDDYNYKRIASFEPFLLPGGEKAIKEPRRSLIGILHKLRDSGFDYIELINPKFSTTEKENLLKMLEKKINSPITSSVGRIFDAVASLLNLIDVMNYEGQAGLLLENKSAAYVKDSYAFKLIKNELLTIKWEEIFLGIIADLKKRQEVLIISEKFHNTMAKIIYETAKYFEFDKVLLSGGCFQNLVLLKKVINLLEKNGIKVYHHQRIPTNDGGISFGQIYAYLQHKNKLEV